MSRAACAAHARPPTAGGNAPRPPSRGWCGPPSRAADGGSLYEVLTVPHCPCRPYRVPRAALLREPLRPTSPRRPPPTAVPP
eukprot:7236018-Prymnesium_polylepis.1